MRLQFSKMTERKGESDFSASQSFVDPGDREKCVADAPIPCADESILVKHSYTLSSSTSPRPLKEGL